MKNYKYHADNAQDAKSITHASGHLDYVMNYNSTKTHLSSRLPITMNHYLEISHWKTDKKDDPMPSAYSLNDFVDITIDTILKDLSNTTLAGNMAIQLTARTITRLYSEKILAKIANSGEPPNTVTSYIAARYLKNYGENIQEPETTDTETVKSEK